MDFLENGYEWEGELEVKVILVVGLLGEVRFYLFCGG